MGNSHRLLDNDMNYLDDTTDDARTSTVFLSRPRNASVVYYRTDGKSIAAIDGLLSSAQLLYDIDR